MSDSPSQTSNSATELYEAARDALQGGKLDQALALATRLAQEGGRPKEAQQLAMAMAVRNPTLEGAFELVNQLCPSGADEGTTLAFYDKLQKKFPQAPLPKRYALALMTKVGQAVASGLGAPGGQTAQASKVQMLRLAMQANEAPVVVETGFALYEDSKDTQYLEAVARFSGGLPPDEAIKALEKLTTLVPDKGPWLIALARQQLRGMDFVATLKTIQRYQDLPFAQPNLVAGVLLPVFEKATQALKADENPLSPEAWEETLMGLHTCLSHLHGQEPELSVKVGETMLKLGKFHEADELFRAANEHPAMRARALIGETKALMGLNQHRQAEGLAMRALEELRNEDRDLLWLLAQATKEQDPRMAVSALERFVKAHPELNDREPTSEQAKALLEELRQSNKSKRSTLPSVYNPTKTSATTVEKPITKVETDEPEQPIQRKKGDDDAAAFFANMREKYAAPAGGVTPESVHKPRTEGEIAKEKLFSRYKTERTLGKGGMGTVYMAQDTLLDRIVAIKIINSSGLTAKDSIDRMGREAKAIAKLSHPNVIQVFDVGLFPDFKYLVMEYVDGLSLKQLLQRKGEGLPLASTKHIALQVADALFHAHEKAIVHRDVKPDNVLVSRSGEVKVMDFGLAKFVDNSEQTIDGITAGTLQYMAPEQFSGKNLDHRADIYAFGCLFFEMLTGKPAFEGSELTKMMYKHLHDAPPSLPETLGPKKDALQTLVHHCLAKNATDRPATMKEVYEQMGKIL